jgi:hypothetical protein
VSTDDTLLADLAILFDPTEVLPPVPSEAEFEALSFAVAEQFGTTSVAEMPSGTELALLEAALSTDAVLPAEPSADELSRLGSAVNEVFGAGTGSSPVGDDGPIALSDMRLPLRTRVRRRLVGSTTIFVAAGVLATGTAAAAATAAHLPFTRPLAQIAHDIGLPVHSPRYDDAQAEADQLAQDVTSGDVAAVERDLASLRKDEHNLDPGERAQVTADTTVTVAQAETVIASDPNPAPPPVDVTPPPTDQTTIPPDTTTTTDASTTTTTDASTTTTDASSSTTDTSAGATP